MAYARQFNRRVQHILTTLLGGNVKTCGKALMALRHSVEPPFPGVSEHPLWRAGEVWTARLMGCQANDYGGSIGERDP
jgi:hypothetical protein